MIYRTAYSRMTAYMHILQRVHEWHSTEFGFEGHTAGSALSRVDVCAPVSSVCVVIFYGMTFGI